MMWTTLCYFPAALLNHLDTPCDQTVLPFADDVDNTMLWTHVLIIWLQYIGFSLVSSVASGFVNKYSIRCMSAFIPINQKHKMAGADPLQGEGKGKGQPLNL